MVGENEEDLGGGNHLPAVLWKPLPLRLTAPALATEMRGQERHSQRTLGNPPSSMFISSSDMVVFGWQARVTGVTGCGRSGGLENPEVRRRRRRWNEPVKISRELPRVFGVLDMLDWLELTSRLKLTVGIR